MSDFGAVLRPTKYRLVPVSRDRRGRLTNEGGISLVLHAAIIASLLLAVPRLSGESLPPPSEVAVVFEGAQPPAAPAIPDGLKSTPSETPDVTQREVAQPTQPSPVSRPASSSQTAAPLMPDTSQQAPPAPTPGATISDAEQGAADLTLPPPAKISTAGGAVHPRAARPQRPVPPQRAPANALSDSLSAPMSFSLAGHPPPPASVGHLSRGLLLTMAPTAQNRNIMTRYAEARRTLGEDWWAAFSRFVEDHKYYPLSAAEKGEDGQSVLRMTVLRDGTVQSVQVELSSGSPQLDMAWLSEFRGVKVPPFPPGTAENQITFSASMTYILEHM